MAELEETLKNHKLVVRAGIGGENSEHYAWIESPLPSWVKTVDDPIYRTYTQIALEAAQEVVEKTGKPVKIIFEVEYQK